MKANKQYYLRVRNLFIQMGLNNEVNKLDNYFVLNSIYGKDGRIIKLY
jgi:hypothetical protein